MCYITQVPHVLTVACGDRLTDFVVVASTSRIAKSANVIFPFVASMKYSATSARYQGLRCFTNWIIFTRYHHMYFTNWIINLHVTIVTRYLVCVLQNFEKRRTKRRTALNNVVSETSLPTTRYDTSFESLINTRQHAIEDIVRDTLQQHGYTNAFVPL